MVTKKKTQEEMFNTIVSNIINKIVEKKVQGVVMMQLDAMIGNAITSKLKNNDPEDIVLNWLEDNSQLFFENDEICKMFDKYVEKYSKEFFSTNIIKEYVDEDIIIERIEERVDDYFQDVLKQKINKAIEKKISSQIKNLSIEVK